MATAAPNTPDTPGTPGAPDVAAGTRARPRVAVWKFASCDGCQLSLLDCEDELLEVAAAIDVVDFAEATSHRGDPPYDVSFVEGSITTEDDARRIRAIRAESTLVVTIGACATAGGVQALRDALDTPELVASVYPRPDWIATLDDSTPISAHVDVDLELRGCPIDRRQLLTAVIELVHGRLPAFPETPVCVECKRAGNPCVLVAHGTTCLGPVTHGGCGALCPTYRRGCFGCFGPSEAASSEAAAQRLVRRIGLDVGVDVGVEVGVEIGRVLRTHTPASFGLVEGGATDG